MASGVPTFASNGKLAFVADLIDKSHVSLFVGQKILLIKFYAKNTGVLVLCALQQQLMYL
jgi:hypothetical protein